QAAAALRWSLVAGDEAMRMLAVRDAIAHYEQARRIRDSDGDGLQAAKESVVIAPCDLSQLYLQLGWAYELQSAFARAKSIYEEMLTLAQEMQESAMECAALNRLATLAGWNNPESRRAKELLHQALSIAESSGNTAGIAETAWNL